MLKNLAGLHVGSKQVERAAEALGQQIISREKSDVCQELPCSPTMYLGIAGTGCPMRKEETEGRAGKQPHGSAKTREVKLAVVFSADSRDSHGKPTRDVGSASYNAAIESAATADVDESPSEFVTRAVEHELAGTAVRLESRRVKFPLIRSKQLGSVRVSPDRVAMLLEREDLDVSS